MNNIPIKRDGQSTLFMKNVGQVLDSSEIQTNLVRVNGRKEVYIPIYRQPGSNTIAIVNGIKSMLIPIESRLPKGIHLAVTFDQASYVKDAIGNLSDEVMIGGGLAVLVVLIFLGSFRSTLIIAISLPLSIAFAVAGLYFTGNSINLMTLGGLGLVLGRLIDDAIVVLENTHRHLEMGKTPYQAALDAAGEVAMPVLAATMATIAVFLPVVFLTGIGRYLFEPLALTVTCAIIASYLCAMTVVPVLGAWLLPKQLLKLHDGNASRKYVGRRFSRWLSGVTGEYVDWAIRRRWSVVAAVALLFFGSLALYMRIGEELFPYTDVGQFTILIHAPSGTGLPQTDALVQRVAVAVRKVIPPNQLKMVISNTGVLSDWPAAYTPNAGVMDAFMLVQLRTGHRVGTRTYVGQLRAALPQLFPGVQFSFQTGGMLSAALNQGRPSPIDIRIIGNKLHVAYRLARQIQLAAEQVPGAVGVHIQQHLNYPQINIHISRTRLAYLGLDEKEVVENVETALNSSIAFDPAFWIDHSNGNHYFLGVQYPSSHIVSLATIENIPVTGRGQHDPVPLRNIATFSRGTVPAEIDHYDINRVVDVLVNVSGRPLNVVAAGVRHQVDRVRLRMAQTDNAATAAGRSEPWRGYTISIGGEIKSMASSFSSLLVGLVLATLLVYLLLVAQFRSFLDPLIVMVAVPLGFIGVLWMLYLSGTTLNVESFLGTIFMVGIAVSNAVLLVEFANRSMVERKLSSSDAAVEAVKIRLRPILMTSLAAVIGLAPMAIGFGHAAQASVPLARAVVGGLVASTFLVLIFVPILYTFVKPQRGTGDNR
ncbi:MAG: efflux RND transporter permease subunit, partial [Phycisphaerae bacterium]